MDDESLLKIFKEETGTQMGGDSSDKNVVSCEW